MYSDHAPIFYNLNTPTSIPGYKQNEYVNIITWNVGQFGDTQDRNGDLVFNHKFHMERVELSNEYERRLGNLVSAMVIMLQKPSTRVINPYYPTKGQNYPFLFCQELPTAEPYRSQFIDLLTVNELGLLCDSDRANPNQFALILKQNMQKSQQFSVLNKSDYEKSMYPDGSLVFPNTDPSKKYPNGMRDKDFMRFEIYYYESQITYYYVNVHVSGASQEPAVIVNFFNKIVDVIQLYRTTRGQTINNVTIYIIGDYNFNIASPVINDLIRIKYDNNPLNLFAHRDLGRKIINMYKFTTENAQGYSLIDYKGNCSPCNIDCMLKLYLAPA